MKPESGNRLKLQTAVSRARMMLKQHLEWLPGFVIREQSDESNPVTDDTKVSWLYFANDRKIKEKRISRDDIRIAESAIKKLVYRFPRALPEIVTSVGEWQSRMNYVLEICKGWVHDGQVPNFDSVLQSDVLPRRWSRRMRLAMRANPSLSSLLEALGYLELTGLQSPSIQAIQWVEENSLSLSKLAASDQWNAKQTISLQYSMWRARHVMPPRLLANLSELFSNTNAYHYPKAKALKRIDDYQTKVKETLKRRSDYQETLQKRTPESRKPRKNVVGKMVHDLFIQSFEVKQKRQQKLLQLMDMWLTSDFVSSIAYLKQELDANEKRWLRILNQAQARRLPARITEDVDRLKAESESLENDAKPFLETVDRFCSSLQKISPRYHFRETQEFDWLAILGQLPVYLRTGMFLRWTNYVERDFARCADLMFTLGQLASLLKKHKLSKSLVEHWESLSGNNNDDLVMNACDNFSGDRKILGGMIRLLGRLLAPHPTRISSSMLESTASFFAGAKDIELAEKMMRELGGTDKLYVESEEVELAIRFSRSFADSCAILKVIAKDYESRESLQGLSPLADHVELKSAIAQIVRDKQLGKLEHLHWICLILKHFGSIGNCLDQMAAACSCNENADQKWIASYPDAFRDSLTRLAKHSGSAEKTAGRILGKDFPNRNALQTEKNVIESKLAAMPNPDSELALRLAGRLKNIEGFLQTANEVSLQRAENLIDKIAARTRHEVVEQFVHHGREISISRFRGSPNADAVLEKLLQPKYGRLLAGILQLTPGNQKLGLRLLFETEAGTTDCFDTEPANTQFVEAMETAGVNPAPWIQGESWTEKTKSGQPYTLEFTNEVFDYLLMGFHFDTCLSPGSVNFFSAIANAVDINKKVLYGKTANGKVIGRCLFVLNNRFQILTFQRYQHDEASQFEDAVNRFAKVLAEKMNTVLGSEGPVRNLVACEWYDDGAVAGEPGHFAPGGAVERAIEAAPLGGKLAAVLALATRQELVNHLQQVLHLASEADCQEFKRDLLQELAQEPELGVRQRIELATFANEQELKPFIKQFLADLKAKPLLRFLKRDYCCEYCKCFKSCGTYADVFGLLAELNASMCLRAIRATRPATIRSDLEDTNKYRRPFLALAHRQLGRDALADRLLAKS